MRYSYASNYNVKYKKENMAKVVGRALPISTKFAVEICSFIRHKNLSDAKKILQEVIELKRAIPFRRYKRDLSHKKEVGPGRYPKKASKEVLKLIESVEANAQFKGLNTSNLEIVHICAHKASRPWHYGRKRGRRMKRTHIEIIVEEKSSKEEKKAKND